MEIKKDNYMKYRKTRNSLKIYFLKIGVIFKNSQYGVDHTQRVPAAG